jgi:hypothetical protein
MKGLNVSMDSEDSTISTSTTLSRLDSEESTDSKYEKLQEQFDQLQSEYDEKCNELVERENDLKAARIEIEELQILLKSHTGEHCSSTVPPTMQAGPGNSGPSGVAGNPQTEELRRMFAWLAEYVELEDPIQFNASDHNLVVAGQPVRMDNIVQWRLSQTDLRLTVPEELASEISNLLAATKMNRNAMCDAKAKDILDSWLLTTGQPPSENMSAVTLLTHRDSHVSCIVANFPVPLPLQEFAGYRVGDTVEVNFEGEWYRGAVKFIANDGEVSVQCDVDPPGVLTTTPSNYLRRPVDPSHSAPQNKPEVDTPVIPEMPQPPPQVESNPGVPESPSPPPQHKMTFSHARTRTCP